VPLGLSFDLTPTYINRFGALANAARKPALLNAPSGVPLLLVFCVAVPLLNSALEPITPAVDGSQIVVVELAPMLFDSADELLPVPLNAIPIHGGLRCRIELRAGQGSS